MAWWVWCGLVCLQGKVPAKSPFPPPIPRCRATKEDPADQRGLDGRQRMDGVGGASQKGYSELLKISATGSSELRSTTLAMQANVCLVVFNEPLMLISLYSEIVKRHRLTIYDLRIQIFANSRRKRYKAHQPGCCANQEGETFGGQDVPQSTRRQDKKQRTETQPGEKQPGSKERFPDRSLAGFKPSFPKSLWRLILAGIPSGIQRHSKTAFDPKAGWMILAQSQETGTSSPTPCPPYRVVVWEKMGGGRNIMKGRKKKEKRKKEKEEGRKEGRKRKKEKGERERQGKGRKEEKDRKRKRKKR
ncbi:hypothetical protein L345_14647, partial [Ophiophagus hannah]